MSEQSPYRLPPTQLPSQPYVMAVPVSAPRRGARPGFGRGLFYGMGIPLAASGLNALVAVAAPELQAVGGLLWVVAFVGTLVAAVVFVITKRHVSGIGLGMLLGLPLGLAGQVVATILMAAMRSPS